MNTLHKVMQLQQYSRLSTPYILTFYVITIYLILVHYLYMTFIKMAQKSFKNIVVWEDTYERLRNRGNVTDSFNRVITEILRHHERAVSIIGDCESCRAKFKAAVQGE